uniref:Uncharacterized protein n=1 Tax=mine drainage metagenome TaxID=410659 RepID=E6QLD9_9ZZZZ
MIIFYHLRFYGSGFIPKTVFFRRP